MLLLSLLTSSYFLLIIFNILSNLGSWSILFLPIILLFYFKIFEIFYNFLWHCFLVSSSAFVHWDSYSRSSIYIFFPLGIQHFEHLFEFWSTLLKKNWSQFAKYFKNWPKIVTNPNVLSKFPQVRFVCRCSTRLRSFHELVLLSLIWPLVSHPSATINLCWKSLPLTSISHLCHLQRLLFVNLP